MSHVTAVTRSTTGGWARRSVGFGSDVLSLIAMGLFTPVAVLLIGTPVALIVQGMIALVSWIVEAI